MADIRILYPHRHPPWKTAMAKKAGGIASNKRKPQNGPQLTHSPGTADPTTVDLQAKSYDTHPTPNTQHPAHHTPHTQNQKLNKTQQNKAKDNDNNFA